MHILWVVGFSTDFSGGQKYYGGILFKWTITYYISQIIDDNKAQKQTTNTAENT